MKSIKLGHTTVLSNMTSNEVQNLKIDTICKAARLGDALALQAIHEAALYMAVGMTNLINLLNPEAIIVTGWVHDVEDILLPKIQEITAKRALAPLAQRVRLIPAHFKQDTMAHGASALALCAAGIVPSNTTMCHVDTSQTQWPMLIKPHNPNR
jgi:glucokinase